MNPLRDLMERIADLVGDVVIDPDEPIEGDMPALNEYEIEVLEMLAGKREGEWGAWVGACLESLEDFGLCTSGPNYQITEAGREIVAALEN